MRKPILHEEERETQEERDKEGRTVKAIDDDNITPILLPSIQQFNHSVDLAKRYS